MWLITAHEGKREREKERGDGDGDGEITYCALKSV